MRTFRTIGIVSTAAALLLSASVAFAEDQTTNTRDGKGPGDAREMKASSTAARVEQQREKAAQRLSDIQDKVKKEMAQRLATQFGGLNKTWTDHFAKQLDSFDAVVQKIQVRADIFAGNGKDVASTTAAIQSAKTALATARVAVVAQAATTYTLDTSTLPTTATSTTTGQEKIMQTLRKSFQTLHTTLFKDLFALRDGPMKDARMAVQKAIKTLGPVTGEGEKNASTTKKSDN